MKYNVIPGEATVELDCRLLPGTTEEDMRETVIGRLGDLAAHVEVELVIHAPPVAAAASGDVLRPPGPDRSSTTTRTAIPLPFMVPFATDAKHTAALDVPTYGFSPLRLDPEERFLERFHGVDERVGVEALRWGLPVLYDVVRRFCARSRVARTRRSGLGAAPDRHRVDVPPVVTATPAAARQRKIDRRSRTLGAWASSRLDASRAPSASTGDAPG